QMLLSSESDLKDHKEPMAFPIFGQARVLYALVGAGIKRENIDQAASFLAGSCSCQVKEQNPGTDLLVAADWKKLLKDQAIGVQDLPTVGEIVAKMPETVTITPSTNSPPKAPDKDCCAIMSWVKTNQTLAASTCVFVLLLTAFLIARRDKRTA